MTRAIVVLWLAAAVLGCGGDAEVPVLDGGVRRDDGSGPQPDRAVGELDGAAGDAARVDAPAVDATTSVAPDGSVVTQCSNGVDDDGDGLVDGLDPECTGAADDDEGSFGTGIPGDNRDPYWQDCFFDGDSGHGNDGCRYRTECLYGTAPADSADCAISDECAAFCLPGTPNGCDCFGCCTVRRLSLTVDVVLGASCRIEDIADPEACPRCVKSAECENTCETCELCPGRTEADLPSTCAAPDAGVPGHTCGSGEATCGTDLPSCEAGLICQYGCCIASLV